jgi:lipid-A-disaccharide synthase
MVVAYKVSRLEGQLKHLVRVPSIVLANLILGENVVPERVQRDCTPEKLADAMRPLLTPSPEREMQLQAFARLDAIMEADSGTTPSERAARVVLCQIEQAGRKA